jgi:hypothetical protein
MGETQVRSDSEHGRILHLASTWLAGKEREAKKREAGFQGGANRINAATGSL